MQGIQSSGLYDFALFIAHVQVFQVKEEVDYFGAVSGGKSWLGFEFFPPDIVFKSLSHVRY
jgi:hypothetical protein